MIDLSKPFPIPDLTLRPGLCQLCGKEEHSGNLSAEVECRIQSAITFLDLARKAGVTSSLLAAWIMDHEPEVYNGERYIEGTSLRDYLKR